MDIQTVWSPQSGPQQALVDCPFPEIFFGGARGGGKTDGVLGKWAIKEKRYGSDFNAIMFRRTTVSAEDAVERSKQIYLPLGAKFVGSPNPTWRMPNGGRVSFRYLESVDDAQEWQGRNVTDAWVEEAGQYPASAPIDRLFGVLRSAAGVPVQMILTANPGGAGQHWIKDRYKLFPFPEAPVVLRRELPDGSMHAMAVIPSRLRDNKILRSRDPKYINRLQLVGSKELVRAWLEGDWSAIEGAFFDEWSEGRHVVRPFVVPPDWKRFRSMHWGSARPFSVGWWAICPDDHEAINLHAQSLVIPRGALVRYREWYGAKAPNEGLKMTAEDVARGILERETVEAPDGTPVREQMVYGVLDPSAFKQDGGPSIAEMMARSRVGFAPADNTRVPQRGAMSGWNQVRQRLRGDADGRAMMVFFSTCKDAIRTLPVLQHDHDRPEDVDTESEDHAPDEIRYACNSRPFLPEKPREKSKNLTFVADAATGQIKSTWTINEIIRRKERARKGL
jgi:Phage terminase large subunit